MSCPLVDLNLLISKAEYCYIGFSVGGGVETLDFPECLVACDLKIGRYSQFTVLIFM